MSEKKLTKEEKDELVQVFKTYDRDGNGYITESELMEALKQNGTKFTKGDIQKLIKSIDKNKDGKIDFAEFTNYIY